MPQIKFNKDAGIPYSKWADTMWDKGFQFSSHDLATKLNVSPPTALSYFASLNYVVYNPQNLFKKMAYFKLSDVNDYCNSHAIFTAQTRAVMVEHAAMTIAEDKLSTVAKGKKNLECYAKQLKEWARSVWSVTGINEDLCWFASAARLKFCARNRGNFERVNVDAEKYKDFFIHAAIQRGKHETAHPETYRRNWFETGAIRAEIKSPGKTKALIIHFHDWNIKGNYIIVPAIYNDIDLKSAKIKDKCKGMIVECGKSAFGCIDV